MLDEHEKPIWAVQIISFLLVASVVFWLIRNSLH